MYCTSVFLDSKLLGSPSTDDQHIPLLLARALRVGRRRTMLVSETGGLPVSAVGAGRGAEPGAKTV